ncbi:tudor domain-containing 6 [Brachyhypopomus gauderio]|uniref:tudor domain-containing 6 n=1 Tax=Brachyhypopomus gauderio TaxID=698409 RepID=UPI0040433818
MCSIPGLPLPGSRVSVLITRVNLNPLCVLVEFWGNFDQDRRLSYQRMKKEIQYPKVVFNETEGNPGDLCLVRIYETWYRARIVSRNASDYSVFLIDEGRTLRASTSTLAWGQTDFFYLPPEVEFCVLANVLPLSPENRWSPMALEFLKTFCGRTVMASVQDVIVPQRTFLLDIPCLSKQMYEMGFVKKLSNERFKDFVTKSLQDCSGSVEPQKTTALRNERVEVIEQTEKQQWYMYPELQTETVETVVVTEVTNPLRVFCQLKVFSQELKKLTDQLTQHFEGRVGTHFARVENLGTPCASRGNDGKWYRSVLQQVMSSNNVAEVLHVDYGKKQFVQVEHVRPLPPEFFRMPVVTYVCSLHGVVDRGVGWTAPQIDYLKSLLLNRTVIARFEYQSLSEGVHYVTLYGDENTNINSLFGSREKCTVDPKSHGDYTVQKSPTEKCQISVKAHKESTDPTNLGDSKGNKPVFFTACLSPNTSHVAVVQHVDSPSKFWIQTQEYGDEFDHLMVALGELYTDPTSAEGLIRKPVVGLVCVAKSQDDVFYRAAISKVVNKQVEVFFLDYGNTELVDCLSLRELPLEYQKLPALAIKCALYGIKPNCEHWDQKTTSFFSKAVQDKVLNVHVLAKSQDTHVVQVMDPLSDGEQDLTKLLCNAGLADRATLGKTLSNPIVKPCSSVMQTSDIIQTSAVSQSSSSLARPRSAFKEYLFPIGSLVEVTVSYIESPNDFWCQKANNKESLKLLMQDLQEYYANSEFHPPLEAACVARNPDNGMWYRGLVIQKHQTPHMTVLFVDYGQTKKVALHDLRHIDPAFVKLKGQAFRCSLYNLNHPASCFTSAWSPDATMQFREFVDTATSMNIDLKCTVYAVMYNAQKVVFNVVDLETPFQSVCSLLIQRGLADCAPSKKAVLHPFHLDSYYFSTHGIKTGSEEDVSIISVTNVNHFFCHLRRNSVQVEELATKVNNICRQLENIECPKTFGKVCFAKYTDGLWYRGQIKSTKSSIVVYFVDYGDTQEVQKADLLPVPFEASEIMSVPVQAIECGLSGMPDNVPDEVNNWFENFVIDRSLKALVVAKEQDSKLIVELYDGTIQVNAAIKEKFHVESERKEITKKRFLAKDMDACSKPHYRIENGSDDKAPGKKKTEIGEDGVQRFKREKEPQWTCGPWKTQNSDGLVATPKKSHDGDTRGKVQQMESNHQEESHGESTEQNGLQPANLPLKVVKPGQKTEVFISHCNSPLSFFVQLVSDETEIYSMVEKLNNDQAEFVPVTFSDIHEGDLVSAVFPDDNCWYRAVIRKAPCNDIVGVEFIDFGNSAEVSVSKIGRLDRSFFLHPRYSIHCSLTGVLYVDDSEMTSSFKKEMEENADGLVCTFIKLSGSVWEVSLEAHGLLLGSSCSRDTAVADAPKSPVTEQEPSPINPCTYKSPDISSGQMIAAYATFISGPHLFWCQYAETENLQEISDIIQKAGNAMETKALSEELLSVGSGCISLFAEDELWYRAKVTSREHDTLSVLFVDYGNESKVKVSEVRPLPSEVSDFPPQAFACQLDGFDVSEGFWNDGANDHFFELIIDRLLEVTILKLGSSHDVESPHFVKLECDKLVINDAIKSFWHQCGEKTSLELTNALVEMADDFSVVTEIESCEHGSESLGPNDLFQSDTKCLSSDPFILTPELLPPKVEGTVAGQAEMLDESNFDIGMVSSQDDVELENIKVSIVDELELKASENHEHDDKNTEVKDSNVDVGSDICANQPADVVRECLLDGSGEASQYPQADLPQNNERKEISKPLSDIDKDAMATLPQEEQPCEFDENVYTCTQMDSPISELEKDLHETIKSDLGQLRRPAQRSPVGSECVVRSYAHANWCRAQILKLYDDSTLVLLLEHDSEMLVDPVNIFEIVPEKTVELQVSCGADSKRSEEDMMFDGRTPAVGPVNTLPKADETEAGVRFSSSESSDNGGEVVTESSSDLDISVEEQPEDHENSCSGDLEAESELPLHEDMNGPSNSRTRALETSEMFNEVISVEQEDPALAAEPGVDPALAAEPGVDPALAAEPGVDPALAAEPGVDPALAAEPGADPALAAEPGADPALAAEPGADPALAAEPGADPALAAEPGADPALAAEPGADPALAAEPGADPALAAEPGADPALAAEPGADPALAAEPTLAAEPGADPTLAAEPRTDPALAAEPGTDPEQCFNFALNVLIINEDAEESPPQEKQTDQSSKTSEGTHELLKSLAVTPLDQVQDVEAEGDPYQGDLTDKVNEDLVNLASDSELESDTASDDTLQGDTVEANPLPAVEEACGSPVKPSTFEHHDSSELDFPVTHLTLKVEDRSDEDVIL